MLRRLVDLLYFSWAFNQYSMHILSLLILNQQKQNNDLRKYSLINLHNIWGWPKTELLGSAIRLATDCATGPHEGVTLLLVLIIVTLCSLFACCVIFHAFF